MQVNHLEMNVEGKFFAVFVEFDVLTRLMNLTFDLSAQKPAKKIDVELVKEAVAGCFHMPSYSQVHEFVLEDGVIPMAWLGKKIDKVEKQIRMATKCAWSRKR